MHHYWCTTVVEKKIYRKDTNSSMNHTWLSLFAATRTLMLQTVHCVLTFSMKCFDNCTLPGCFAADQPTNRKKNSISLNFFFYILQSCWFILHFWASGHKYSLTNFFEPIDVTFKVFFRLWTSRNWKKILNQSERKMTVSCHATFRIKSIGRKWKCEHTHIKNEIIIFFQENYCVRTKHAQLFVIHYAWSRTVSKVLTGAIKNNLKIKIFGVGFTNL